MRIKSLTPLLFSTFLVPSFAYAMVEDVRVSDGLNGVVLRSTTSSSSSSASTSDAQAGDQLRAKIAKKLQNKNIASGTAFDQVERFYGPITRHEHATPELRRVVNALCSFFEGKANKASSMLMYFEGQEPGEAFELSSATKSGLTSTDMAYGKHIAMVRKVENCSQEISNLESKQKSFPTVQAKHDKDITAEQTKLKAAQVELANIQNQEDEARKVVNAAEEALKTAQQRLETLTPAINEINQHLDSIEESQQSSSSVVSDRPAENLELAAQLVGSLASQAQERAILSKEIEAARDNLMKAREKLHDVEKPKNDKEQEIVSIEEAIQNLKNALARDKDYQEALPQKIAELQKTKQEEQDKADTYALMKYFQLLNIYLALPNDDKSYYDQDVKLATLNPHSLPLIRQLGNENQKIGFGNAKHQLESFTSKMQSKTINTYLDSNCRKLIENTIVNYSSTYSLPTNKIASGIAENLSAPLNQLIPALLKNEVAKSLTPPPPVDELTFDKQHDKNLNDLRADKLVKASMEKWKKKISKDEGSIVKRLGLVSYLFNGTFDLKKSPDFFSLAQFEKEFSVDREIESKEYSIDHILLGLTQIQTTHYVDSENTEVRNRTDCIYNFLFAKEAKRHEQIRASTSSTSTNTTSSVEKQMTDGEKATKATLKYLSYANMAMGLRYDIQGQKVEPLTLCPLGFEKLLKEPLTDKDRLDNFLARKATKWAHRLQGDKTFVKKYSLDAYTFAPLDILEGKEEGEETKS